jgi:hypothetical protein
MKFFAVLVFCLGLVVSSYAQEPADRKKLVFQPGADVPMPTPTAKTETKGLDAGQVIDLFFLALQADKVDNAYDALVKNTIIAERAEDVAALKARTKEAIENYGPIRGYEIVEELSVGKNLLRRTCLSLNSDLPLRWRFYFYKGSGTWKLVDLRVDDGLVELFEDAARKKP